MEKSSKKLKPFFDAGQKYKYRLAALLAFIDPAATAEGEQAKVYQEHAREMVAFVVESHAVCLERIAEDRDFYSKFERSLGARDGQEEGLYKVPLLMARVIKHLKGELPAMEDAFKLVAIIRTMLHPLNNSLLRREGMHLLLLWLKEAADDAASAALLATLRELFSAAIVLAPFAKAGHDPLLHVGSLSASQGDMPAAASLGQAAFPYQGGDRSELPMFSASPALSDQEQSLRLLDDTLHYLTFDRDAARKSTLLIYDLIYEHYFQKFYPTIALASQQAPREAVGFVSGCPYDIQAMIMRYVCMWTMQKSDLFQGTIPMATFILQEIILGCERSLDFVHQVIQQSILLPYTYKETVRLSIDVMRTWLFTSKDRRPAFLQGTADAAAAVTSAEGHAGSPAGDGAEDAGRARAASLRGSSLGASGESIGTLAMRALPAMQGAATAKNFDSYLQKYIGTIALLFDGRQSVNFVQEQAELYREGIYFLRGIAIKTYFGLTSESWDVLINVLLGVAETHLAPYIAGHQDEQDFAQLLIETIFGVIIRSESTAVAHWESLAGLLGQCTHWSSVVGEWRVAVEELTAIMAAVVLTNNLGNQGSGLGSMATTSNQAGIMATPPLSAAAGAAPAGGMASAPLAAGAAGTGSDRQAVAESMAATVASANKKRTFKSGTFEGANVQRLLTRPSPLGRAMISEMHLISPRYSLASFARSVDRTSDSFLAWHELKWTRDNVVFLWRNMLRALGDINNIEDATIHASAIGCLLDIVERMLAIREAQPYIWRPLPPIYEFATTLFDACDLSERSFNYSRYLAYTAICRMFSRRHDIPFPDEYYIRFYLALVNGLADKDDAAASIILINGSNLFGRHLPGSHLLIPAFAKCIAGMLNNAISEESSATIVPMLRIIGNFAALSDVYASGLALPRIEAPLALLSAIPITRAGETNLESIAMQSKDLLMMIDYQDHVRNDSAVHSTLLSVVGSLLCDSLVSQAEPRQILVDGYLNILLDHLLPKDAPVLPATFEAFYALSQVIPLVGEEKFGRERHVMIVQRIVTGIRSAFADVEFSLSAQDELVARLVNLLVEWIMLLPADWLSRQHSLREQIFAVLDDAIKRPTITTASAQGGRQSVPPSSGAPTTMGSGTAAGALYGAAGGEATLRRERHGTEQSISGSLYQAPSSAQQQPASPMEERASSAHTNGTESAAAVFLMREAAEFAIIHLQHHLSNFSPDLGPTMVNSQVADPLWNVGGGEGCERILYFSFDDSSIIAFQQLPQEGTESVRIIVRNAAGKFTWDARTFFETFDHRASTLYRPEDRQNWQDVGRLRHLILSGVQAVSSVDGNEAGDHGAGSLATSTYGSLGSLAGHAFEQGGQKFQREEGQMPAFASEHQEGSAVDLAGTDMLRELLCYIGERHGETCTRAANKPSLCTPDAVAAERQASVQVVASACRRQVAVEEAVSGEYLGHAATSVGREEGDAGSAEDAVCQSSPHHECSKPLRGKMGLVGTFQFGRQLLANFGFLSALERGHASASGGAGPVEENIVMPLKVLSRTSGLLRDLKALDRKSARETVKLALIYVAPGQEDESLILRNNSGSPSYEKFCASLGWKVDLAKHVGYTGGLESGVTAGNEALYYCTSLVECIFHDATQIVVEATDEKLIGRKRHIGNDYVHIIWNEHYRDYRPTTMRGDYGNAQIVISPLPSSHLYRISIHRDAALPPFGPLYDGALVPRASLGVLVRATAINAHRCVLAHLAMSLPRHPMALRVRDISQVVTRHGQHRFTLEQLLSYTFFANAPLAEEVASQAAATTFGGASSSGGMSGSGGMGSSGGIVLATTCAAAIAATAPDALSVAHCSSAALLAAASDEEGASAGEEGHLEGASVDLLADQVSGQLVV